MLHANASTGRGIPQGERGVQFKEAIWKHGGVTEGMSKARMRARGTIRVVAGLGAVNKGHYIKVANKSNTDRKEGKALLETKSVNVRITAKVEKLVEDLTNQAQKTELKRKEGLIKCTDLLIEPHSKGQEPFFICWPNSGKSFKLTITRIR